MLHRDVIDARLKPVSRSVRIAISSLLTAGVVALPTAIHAQEAAEKTLGTVVVQASADASAEGLTKSYAGNQVARGGRVGLFGNQDIMDTPFSTTAYTSQLIQDQQAKSVADVVQNDPTVRVARGFGNFQELYIIRGFPVASDDTAYNGLFGLLPRQYVASELIERVEVFRGANSFVTGGVGTSSGFGIGGTINTLPKRAPNEPLNMISAGIETGGQGYLAADVARRFGPEERLGLRINAAQHGGETAVENEKRNLSVFSLGVDYRGNDFRISADLGHQEHRIDDPRPSVTPFGGIPDAPDGDKNFAQPWTYAKERSTFGTLRGEYDFSKDTTAWAAFGMRDGYEKNVVANPMAMENGNTSSYRFDNVRDDKVYSGEAGLRHAFRTGSVGHTVVVSVSHFESESRNAYALSNWAGFSGNLYQPVDVSMPPADFFVGGSMSHPLVTDRISTGSIALADTLTFLDDALRVTLGARQQDLKQKTYNYNTGARESSYDESELTPMFGVVYKVSPTLSVYGNYIEGLSKGETAPATTPGGLPVTNAGRALAPYVAKQTEIGAKLDAGRIGAGVSWFQTDKPFGILEGNTFSDGGQQRNQGIEFTAFGEPTRGVRLLGGITWLEAKLRDTQDGALDGNRAIGVPKTQANLGAEWDIPGVPGFAISGRIVYTGAQYADVANDLSVPSWTRFDLGARYTTSVVNQIVTFRARVDNVTNRDYWASAGGYPGYGYLVLGAPRTFVLSATAEF